MDWCLYVIVRTNLDSMNPGKAQAHSGHAANAFMYKFIELGAIDPLPEVSQQLKQNIAEWIKSTPQGFGTQSNLKAENWNDVHWLYEWAHSNGYLADFIVDPTYPYEVSDEVYHLLHIDYQANARKKGDKWLCFRKETTAFYIFGRSSDLKLQEALRKFPRHP